MIILNDSSLFYRIKEYLVEIESLNLNIFNFDGFRDGCLINESATRKLYCIESINFRYSEHINTLLNYSKKIHTIKWNE